MVIINCKVILCQVKVVCWTVLGLQSTISGHLVEVLELVKNVTKNQKQTTIQMNGLKDLISDIDKVKTVLSHDTFHKLSDLSALVSTRDEKW